MKRDFCCRALLFLLYIFSISLFYKGVFLLILAAEKTAARMTTRRTKNQLAFRNKGGPFLFPGSVDDDAHAIANPPS